ncbi:hypothetical protein LEN26_021017 [Aphanomyces euteiches]|nr:hypothetical protein LEN26_021017 [Aphanomyces euteiches]KAH9117252.1 hypothetical protein AeMF1_008957 [Aphanomyces euteiches]KAH9189182.1 hypothetical protein AeNC1_008837 [Aphanomyces euteiches]
MLVEIPGDVAAQAMLHDSTLVQAYLHDTIAPNDSEPDASYSLHVRDRTKETRLTDDSLTSTEQKLATGCIVWWALHMYKAAAPSIGLAMTRKEDTTHDDSVMEMFAVDDVPFQATVKSIEQFVQDTSDEKVQFVQATSLEVFHGMTTTASLAGHLTNAIHISPFDVLNGDKRNRWFLSTDTLVEVTQQCDFTAPVNVVSTNLHEAAIVATALALAGHTSVSLCSFELTEDVLTQLPSHLTSGMFVPSTVNLANDDGTFDVSTDNEEIPIADDNAKEEILKAYSEANNGAGADDNDKDDIVIEPEQYHEDFFTMPSPLSKEKFLEIAGVIHKYASLVLAPYGILCTNPNPNIAKTTMLESKLKCGPILQEVVETISDLIYDDFNVNESTMAMSSQKWLNDTRNAACANQMQEINQLPQTLINAPVFVELGTIDESQAVPIVKNIQESVAKALHDRVPWALEPVPLPSFSETPKSVADLTWYPAVVYQLGYKFNKTFSHTKQSSLQTKAKIQAVFQGVKEALNKHKTDLNAVQLQAIVDSLPEDDRKIIEQISMDTFTSHHIVNDDVFVDDEMTDDAQRAFNAKLREGDLASRRQDDSGAIRSYTEAMNCVPLYHAVIVDTLTKRAKSYFKLKKFEEAQADCTLALKISPFCLEAYACQGDLAESNREYEKALQNHVLAFILGGSRVIEQAEVIERVSKFVGREQAKDIWSAMIKRHDLPSKWLIDSYFNSFQRDADSGISIRGLTKKEVVDVHDDFEQYFLRAIDHKRNQRYHEAQQHFEALSKYIQENPEVGELKNRVVALNLHATFLYITGDVATALDVINVALTLDPTHVNSVVKKAGFLCELGEFEEAEECFNEAANIDENSSDLYLHRGQMELIMGDYPSAVTSLRRSLTRCDTLAVTHISYGMALYKAGSIYQSLDVFKTALEQFPTSHEVRLFYGDVLSDRADYGQAMMHLKKAFEFSPQCPLPWLNAGRIFVATNDGNHAISHFEQALQVDARCSAAHLDLAQVYFAQGKVDKAFAHFDLATETCRFLPEVEDACACRCVATMQLQATTILGVELRHMLKTKK